MTLYEKLRNCTLEEMANYLAGERMLVINYMFEQFDQIVPDDLKSEVVDMYRKCLLIDIDKPSTRWKIWMRYFDTNGNINGVGVYPQEYAHKCSAIRSAKRVFGENGENKLVKWVVSKTNPFIEG